MKIEDFLKAIKILLCSLLSLMLKASWWQLYSLGYIDPNIASATLIKRVY